jgi:hypothetical protein
MPFAPEDRIMSRYRRKCSPCLNANVPSAGGMQALQIMWKGVSFIPHPKYIGGDGYRERAQQHSTHTCPALLKADDIFIAKDGNGSSTTQRFCTWREAPGYPWG